MGCFGGCIAMWRWILIRRCGFLLVGIFQGNKLESMNVLESEDLMLALLDLDSDLKHWNRKLSMSRTPESSVVQISSRMMRK